MISYCCETSLNLNDYLDDESITGIIGEGVAANHLPSGLWVGSLGELEAGRGYWVISNSDNDIELSYDCDVLPSSDLSRSINEEIINEYAQSTEQAFYFIEDIKDIEEGDVINAYCNDVLVGSRVWAGSYTDIPAMGVDGSEFTHNYCEIGATPTFKVEKTDGEVFELEGDISAWESNGLFMVSSLGIKQVLPEQYSLSNAYPNPFNPTTTIKFAVPEDIKVTLEVYDINGRKINILIDSNIEKGYHSVVWDATNYSSGIYFVKMISDEYINTQKIMLIK